MPEDRVSSDLSHLQRVEKQIHAALEFELVASRDRLRLAGLVAELDPIQRSGSRGIYRSYVEATLWDVDAQAKGGVHDIFYIPVVENGQMINDATKAMVTFKEDLTESLKRKRW